MPMTLRGPLRFIVLLLLPGLALPLMAAPVAAAQEERCFQATGYCISGEILRFWEQSGGLPVFGYPLTPLQEELIEGRPIQVQWFERHRLELHQDQPWPYSVQLGRLGVELLGRRGLPVAAGDGIPQPGCRFFPETGRNLCGELLAGWRSAGVELDGVWGVSEFESLALFGLPLSDAQAETLSDGKTYTVQWFERARLEIHPELGLQPRILNGLLGAELAPRPGAGPQLSLARPVRIGIPTIGIEAPIAAAGLDAQGVPIVPKHDVGWYSLSAAPGEGENVVLWGHVLRWTDAPQIPAPFARVKNLRVGDTITLTTRGEAVHTYVVRQQFWVEPNEVRHILPQGRELLTLVSCIGDQVIVEGEVIDMSHRLITVAVPLG